MEKQFNYTYRIKFEDGRYYYGYHATNKLDDGYVGSPKTHAWRWECFDYEMQILEFFDTRREAYDVESRIIKAFIKDPMCLNAHYQGYIAQEYLGLRGPYECDAKCRQHLEWARSQIDPKNVQAHLTKIHAKFRDNCHLTRASHISRERTSKSTTLLHIATGEIFTFASQHEACKQLNLSPSRISLMRSGRAKTHKGYKLL